MPNASMHGWTFLQTWRRLPVQTMFSMLIAIPLLDRSPIFLPPPLATPSTSSTPHLPWRYHCTIIDFFAGTLSCSLNRLVLFCYLQYIDHGLNTEQPSSTSPVERTLLTARTILEDRLHRPGNCCWHFSNYVDVWRYI